MSREQAALPGRMISRQVDTAASSSSRAICDLESRSLLMCARLWHLYVVSALSCLRASPSSAGTRLVGPIRFVTSRSVRPHPSPGTDIAQEKSKYPLINFALCVASTTTTLIVLLYAFVEEYTSSKFHYTNYDSAGQHFTRESWACQMRFLYPDYDFWWPACSNAVGALQTDRVFDCTDCRHRQLHVGFCFLFSSALPHLLL